MRLTDRSNEVRTIAVIGAGHAGRAFAFRCSDAGLTVVLEDVMPANLRHAEAEHNGRGAEGADASISYCGSVEDAVRHADLVVDFVPDQLESKLEIFSMLDRMAPPRTILCTPTLALSITDLASCTYRPDRCVGLKSSGTDILLGEEIEVVCSRFLSEETAAAIETLFSRLELRIKFVADDKEPMLVKNADPNSAIP